MLEELKNCIGLSEHLKNEVYSEYMHQLKFFLQNEIQKGKAIYPPTDLIFNAFKLIPYTDYKVVIIGQDPYHGFLQANGLAFSVQANQKIPPSLKNIFKELKNDVGMEAPLNGDLSAWAKQGVLLMNSVLTVEHGLPGSHQKKGWEKFTDTIIKNLSEDLTGIVFMLWGNYAKSKKPLINSHKHLILEANHPSPLSASRGFFNCKHFSKTNSYLMGHGKTPINWNL